MTLEWMNIKQTLEEELALENQIRAINDEDDLTTLQELCKALWRQNWHQTKLLSQCVGRIAELDAASMYELD